MKRLVLAALLGLACTSCNTLAPLLLNRSSVDDCGGEIPSTELLANDFDKRLRVEVRAEKVVEGFEVVVQKRGARLVVLGLTRFGGRAFTIQQEGERLEIDSPMKPIERVSPVNILRDLYVWPLRVSRPDDTVELEVSDDGRSATLVHRRCGFTTVIAEIDGTDG